MNQVQYFMEKIITGETYNVSTQELNDLNYYYNVHTLIILGNSKTVCDLTIDGLDIKLSTGFVYNYTPISTITVNSAPSGVLLIGKKIKKQIF